MSNVDISEVPTRRLVLEAMSRAPICPVHNVRMIVLCSTWWTCPVPDCHRTRDYEELT